MTIHVKCKSRRTGILTMDLDLPPVLHGHVRDELVGGLAAEVLTIVLHPGLQLEHRGGDVPILTGLHRTTSLVMNLADIPSLMLLRTFHMCIRSHKRVIFNLMKH